MTMTLEQMIRDIDFLARRAQRAGCFETGHGHRDWGVSSNSLVSLAYGVGDLEMPSDWFDYAACERAARNLPPHRRTTAIDAALALQKSHVISKYPEGIGHYVEAMPADFVNK